MRYLASSNLLEFSRGIYDFHTLWAYTVREFILKINRDVPMSLIGSYSLPAIADVVSLFKNRDEKIPRVIPAYYLGLLFIA